MRTRRVHKTSVFYSSVFLFLLIVSVFLAEQARADIASHVVINEVQVDSTIGTGGSADDFIELYNPTASEVVLDNWSIQKQASASSSTLSRNVLNGTIKAGGYFLLVRNNVSTNMLLKDKADILLSSSFSLANNNVIYLVNNNENIVNEEDTNIIDYVGMGLAERYEGLASAFNPPEAKTIERSPNGEDSNNNSVDFVIIDTPTPSNTQAKNNNVGGTVLLSIMPNEEPVQNISSRSADIIFAVNSNGLAKINYGLNSFYSSSSVDTLINANTSVNISLTDLTCNTLYHYSIYAQNEDNSDNYTTIDATFRTLPCGITIDSLDMIQSQARANDSYTDGWTWNFAITVWDMSETFLKMKFGKWNGGSNLAAGGNMQFSLDGFSWLDIEDDDIYSSLGADISSLDEDVVSAGRQVNIQVRMKIPVNTLAGVYNSNYGILTE